ncbi:MAG: cytochrome c biogenesis CcdA family protein [Proteobacteria bacterium]|nr:cytochrome c biogenesis CcdA family protein [Pseudomonadota bacterium]
MHMSHTVALISGVFSFFSPCILPIIPSYLVFISGITFDGYNEVEFRKYRKVVIVHTLSFIFGFSFVFVSLGLSSSLLGKFFSSYHTYITRFGGLILMVMGMHLLNIIKIPFLNRERVVHLKQKPLGLFGSFIVGATFSVGWTPCVGPVLSSILIMANASQEMAEGAYLLSLYSLGLAIPFFISAIFFHKLFRLLQKFHFMTRYSMKILGVILIIVGLLLLTNYYSVLTIFSNSLFSWIK